MCVLLATGYVLSTPFLAPSPRPSRSAPAGIHYPFAACRMLHTSTSKPIRHTLYSARISTLDSTSTRHSAVIRGTHTKHDSGREAARRARKTVQPSDGDADEGGHGTGGRNVAFRGRFVSRALRCVPGRWWAGARGRERGRARSRSRTGTGTGTEKGEGGRGKEKGEGGTNVGTVQRHGPRADVAGRYSGGAGLALGPEFSARQDQGTDADALTETETEKDAAASTATGRGTQRNDGRGTAKPQHPCSTSAPPNLQRRWQSSVRTVRSTVTVMVLVLVLVLVHLPLTGTPHPAPCARRPLPSCLSVTMISVWCTVLRSQASGLRLQRSAPAYSPFSPANTSSTSLPALLQTGYLVGAIEYAVPNQVAEPYHSHVQADGRFASALGAKGLDTDTLCFSRAGLAGTLPDAGAVIGHRNRARMPEAFARARWSLCSVLGARCYSGARRRGSACCMTRVTGWGVRMKYIQSWARRAVYVRVSCRQDCIVFKFALVGGAVALRGDPAVATAQQQQQHAAWLEAPRQIRFSIYERSVESTCSPAYHPRYAILGGHC
ncbi:hypothetical protein EVG20_g9573 [Dentipellis fragilis]|uniref:Uncharacterized protein n=1 Tax=Dentipellis fragilis TaxID=205917 RepID=A0A4Y9Y1M3_9AGAM|nr:hypothetical protein EVG20_g9573 [Dentipellis fragilis]